METCDRYAIFRAVKTMLSNNLDMLLRVTVFNCLLTLHISYGHCEHILLAVSIAK